MPKISQNDPCLPLFSHELRSCAFSYSTNPPSKPRAPTPTPTHAPVGLGAPPVEAADAAAEGSEPPELGLAPPPAPPPASDEPLVPLVVVPLLSPVADAWGVAAVFTEAELEVGEADAIVTLEPVIEDESVMADPPIIIEAEEEAVVEELLLVVTKLAAPLLPAVPVVSGAPPIPPWRACNSW